MLAGRRSGRVGSSFDWAVAMAAASGTRKNVEAARLPADGFSAWASLSWGMTVEDVGIGSGLVNRRQEYKLDNCSPVSDRRCSR